MKRCGYLPVYAVIYLFSCMNNNRLSLFVSKLLQVGQPLFHHRAIRAFIQQASEFLPGIPLEVKIHVPLQRQGIGRAMFVHLPAIYDWSFISLLQLVNKLSVTCTDGRDFYLRDFAE